MLRRHLAGVLDMALDAQPPPLDALQQQNALIAGRTAPVVRW